MDSRQPRMEEAVQIGSWTASRLIADQTRVRREERIRGSIVVVAAVIARIVVDVVLVLDIFLFLMEASTSLRACAASILRFTRSGRCSELSLSHVEFVTRPTYIKQKKSSNISI